MFAQLLSLVALSVLYAPVPTLAVPGAAWVRRQEDAQSSLTLDPAEISHGLEQDGQGNNPDPGQVRSLTSSNNFINFCLPFLDQGVVLTNGAQVTAGSCNQVPMGRIISLDLAPRCKFVFPKNGDTSIIENQAFTVQMKLLNLEAGNFVNAQTNYYAAPQQANGQGILIGHSHVVIEAIPDLQTTEPLDPNKFAFFKGLNNPVDANNLLSTAVTAGLPAGIYRMCSINTAANHQPALVSNAQHGSLDDCSYFTVQPAGGNATSTASATDSAAAVAATDSATGTDSATATVAEAAASNTASATDAAQTTDAATNSATDAATAADAATGAAATDAPAATDSATDVPAATDSATDAGNNNDASASTDAPAATATDSAAPAATDSAATPDNGNNGNGGDNSNNNNNGRNNDNNNNGGNNDNSGNNGGNNSNGGDNSNNNNGGDSSAAPAATETVAPADDNSSATPSQDAPADSPSAAPEATPTQGSGDNNGGANDNQGGNGGGDNANPSTA